jgi:glycerol-3-phosphate O-acyltransferase / dihydroxyacetone phosphate acyltransferase
MPEEPYIADLGARLTAYQNQLKRLGLKDYRIHAHSNLGIAKIVYRLAIRFTWVCVLGCLSAPGLLLWLPILSVTKERAMRQKKKGPAWDVFDEIAQTKLLYGLVMFSAFLPFFLTLERL